MNILAVFHNPNFTIICNAATLFHVKQGWQLVFEWDRLENFLLTRDRPVGNKVTSTKCQSWASHVQNVYYGLSKWCADRRQRVCNA